jgi:hypothetical protein
VSPAARNGGPQERSDYPSQHKRLILFFPFGETASTTSTFFPQLLQKLVLFFDSIRAATSVFDFFTSAIGLTPFFFQNPEEISSSRSGTRSLPVRNPLLD